MAIAGTARQSAGRMRTSQSCNRANLFARIAGQVCKGKPSPTDLEGIIQIHIAPKRLAPIIDSEPGFSSTIFCSKIFLLKAAWPRAGSVVIF
jgi:hypothetical protein